MKTFAICAIASSWGALSFGACVLPAGEPCCTTSSECSVGARCFEGRCALRCDDDGQCDDGDVCVVAGGVCRAADPSDAELSRCPRSDPGAAP